MLIAPCFGTYAEGRGLDERSQFKARTGHLSNESSALPHKHLGKRRTVTTSARRLNETAIEAVLSSLWINSQPLHLIRTRTHSFAIRPRQAKKPGDSNETLQERRGEERTTRERGERRNTGCEYLEAINAAGGTATPNGSRSGCQGRAAQHG